MSRRKRIAPAGFVFHVVNRAAKRAQLFASAGDYRAFEAILEEGCALFNVAVLAYCVMPNHWHLLIMPRSDHALSRFMHWATTTHASRWHIHRASTGEGAVYQGRFRAIPIGHDYHFLCAARYVERNALRAGLVQRAEDWRWSSAWRRAHADSSWLVEWPVARPTDWLTELNALPPQSEVDAIRSAIRRNRPFGNLEWQAAVAGTIGTARRPPGRPCRQDRCPPKRTTDPNYRLM